jgi:ABC-2 type transport system permease protein
MRTDRGLHSVFERTLHEERRALVAWSVGMVALLAWMLAMYPTVRDSSAMGSLTEEFPDAMKELFGLVDYTTGPGYLRAEVFSFTVPVLLVVVALLWGSDAVAGEEERGTLDLLLANPLPRRRLVAHKLAGVAAAIGIVGVVVFVVLAAGSPVAGLEVAVGRLAGTVAACVLLAVLYAAVALALGAATGRRGLARGVTAALAVAAYLVSQLAGLVSWLRPWRWASPWHHALGVDPLGKGVEPWRLALLAALTALVAAAGAEAFERRDLST